MQLFNVDWAQLGTVGISSHAWHACHALHAEAPARASSITYSCKGPYMSCMHPVSSPAQGLPHLGRRTGRREDSAPRTWRQEAALQW